MAKKASAPYENRSLWPAEKVWSVTTGSAGTAELNYGDIHEMIHRDISLGNDYRKERIKLMITLASAVFALTVTFHKDLFHEALGPDSLRLMLVGWLGLLASLLLGILHLKHWEDFYLEHRALGNAIWRLHTAVTPAEQESARINFLQARTKVDTFQKGYRFANFLQTSTLLLGLLFIGLYVLDGASRASPPKPEQKTCCCANCTQAAPNTGAPAGK